MPTRLRRLGNFAGPFAVGMILSEWLSVAVAQAPTSPASTPVLAESADIRHEALANRLQKMEEMNRQLLQQFEALSEQNKALTTTVKNLSERLDASSKTGASDGDGKGEGEGGGKSNSNACPLTGGLTSATTTAGGQAGGGGGGGKDRVPLKAFNDLSSKQRYGFVLQSRDQEYELRVRSSTPGSPIRTSGPTARTSWTSV